MQVVKDGKYCPSCGLFISNASQESSKTPSLGFREFFKRKEENRREHFKPASKKPKKSAKDVKETEVSINIGIRKCVTGNAILKTARGRTLPVRVLPSAGSSTILEKAVTKHENHNKSMTKGQRYVLLYPDNTEVINLPGSDKPFVLKDYRDEVDKSYSRLTLYIAVQSDFVFAGIDMSYSSSDEETTSAAKSKSDISGDKDM
jgi:hypothetical protein